MFSDLMRPKLGNKYCKYDHIKDILKLGSSNGNFNKTSKIFLVNFTYKNYLTHTYCINLVAAIMRQQKFILA